MQNSAFGPRGPPPRTACDLCRYRKIRCDREKPACETCQVAGVQCTFTPGFPNGKKSLKTQLAEAKARVRSLETTRPETQLAHEPLQKISHFQAPPSSYQPSFIPPTPSLPNPEDFDVSLAAFSWHLEVCGLGASHSPQRASFQHAVRYQTGAYFSVEEFFAQVKHSYQSQYPLKTPQVIRPKWPEDSIMLQCITYYLAEGLYSIFPIVEVNILHGLFDQYVANRTAGITQTSLNACLCAFTAFISKIHGHHPAFLHAEPDAYMQAALTLLPNLLLETKDIRTLEALLLLVLFINPSGQSQSGRMILALAAQMVCHLGGNRMRNQDPNNYHLRALFWHCYAIDREMSIRGCLPPLIPDCDCDLELPPTYVLKSSDRQFLQKPLSPDVLLFPSDLRLAIIKSRIHQLLYSDHALTQPEARRLEHVRQLDTELDDLKSGFPVGFRPDAFASKQIPEYKLHDFSIRGASLHLEYYFCLRKIHEAGVNCSLAVPNHTPLSSSMELYYEASRSTLLYYIRAQGYVDAFNFWIHAHFVLSAVLSLFWYTLEAPSALTVANDLHLMQQTREIFTRLKNNAQDGRCYPPIYMAEAFIIVLINLAKQASKVANTRDNDSIYPG